MSLVRYGHAGALLFGFGGTEVGARPLVLAAQELPLHLCEAIASHHNALSIFSDDSGREAQLKTLLAILKMAEHICQTHQVLGNQEEDHEWQSIEQLVLEYVGLSEYDFENLRESIRELGTV